MDGMPNPLRRLTLEQLRRRTSMKWRTYPEDVLPLWVAEMDVPLAEPVARAIRDAVALGDTGYPAGTAYAEALAEFARTRWGWDGLAVERTAIVPDVMLGIVEMLKLVTGPGRPGGRQLARVPAVLPVRRAHGPAGRRGAARCGRPDRPRGPGGRVPARGRARARPGAAYLLCSPHNPTGTVHTAEELAAVAALARTVRRAGRRRRDPRPAHGGGGDVRALPRACPARRAACR